MIYWVGRLTSHAIPYNWCRSRDQHRDDQRFPYVGQGGRGLQKRHLAKVEYYFVCHFWITFIKNGRKTWSATKLQKGSLIHMLFRIFRILKHLPSRIFAGVKWFMIVSEPQNSLDRLTEFRIMDQRHRPRNRWFLKGRNLVLCILWIYCNLDILISPCSWTSGGKDSLTYKSENSIQIGPQIHKNFILK